MLYALVCVFHDLKNTNTKFHLVPSRRSVETEVKKNLQSIEKAKMQTENKKLCT